jgi:hypothetical protein
MSDGPTKAYQDRNPIPGRKYPYYAPIHPAPIADATGDPEAYSPIIDPTVPLQHGHPEFYRVVEEISKLHDGKNRQYAMPDDPLGNFRRTGKIIAKMLKPGLNPTLASCLAFMSKQVDGVYEIFGEDKKDTFDSLEDKLLDTAVYSIIGIILVREARNGRR